MLDFTFEKIIIAYTVDELMEELKDIDDEVLIKPAEGLWAGIYQYEMMEDTFVDAFDHTIYQHEIFEPVKEGGEFCFGIYVNRGNEIPNHHLVVTAGELKRYLRCYVNPQLKCVSVDDNFELGGAITQKVKMFLLRREDGLTLEFK